MIFCCETSKIVVDNWQWLDPVSKIATICIAGFNIVLTIYIFTRNNKKNQAEKEQDRKLQLFKSLVLDHNLNQFYSFYTDLDLSLQNLKIATLDDLVRQNVISECDSHFINLSRNFIDTLLAVDENLYYTILASADDLQADLNLSISDKGIVLNHLPKFEEVIVQRVTRSKTDILKILYQYR